MTTSGEPSALTPADIPRRPRPRRRTARSLLLLVAVVLVGNAVVGERGLLALLKSQRDMARLSAVIDALRSENEQLRERARELREEPRMIEEVARRELGLIGSEERLFIVTDAMSTATDPGGGPGRPAVLTPAGGGEPTGAVVTE